jgi:electron transport complex protein RnfE
MLRNKIAGIFGRHKSAGPEGLEEIKAGPAPEAAEPAQPPQDVAEPENGTAAPEPAAEPSDRGGIDNSPVRFLEILKTKALRDNSVLIRLLAVCTVLAAATTLKNGLMLSAAAAAVTIPLYLIMALLFKKVPPFIYIAIALTVAGALVTPVCMFANTYFAKISASCGYFLPITAINAALMLDINIARGRRTLLRSLAAGIGDVLGYSVVLIVISALREVIGAGTLFDRAIPGYAGFSFSFALLPPGAFLLVGFALAAVQGVRLHNESRKNSGEAK